MMTKIIVAPLKCLGYFDHFFFSLGIVLTCDISRVKSGNGITLKGKGTLFEKPHFSLSHGQIRANPKGKKSGQIKKIQIWGQKALKSAKIRTKCQNFFGTTD